MEIEKLIERLDDWEGCDAIYKGKFVEANCRIASRLLEEAASALEQLQAENDRLKSQVPRWIPVEERLPGDADGLVVMTDGEHVHPSYGNAMFGLEEKLGVFAPTKKKPWGFMQVTHWMPLPKAPKEEKKND